MWYQTDYNIYTTRQASRRSWRIGQTDPVQVYYLSYEETLQEKALSLVANKMKTSLAIEGEIPQEGLSSFHEGNDIMLELARQIVSNDNEKVNGELAGAIREAVIADLQKEELITNEAWEHAMTKEPVPIEPKTVEGSFTVQIPEGAKVGPPREEKPAPPIPPHSDSMFDQLTLF